MSSLLAGVATGYDVRLSNVTPVHPKLQPLPDGVHEPQYIPLKHQQQLDKEVSAINEQPFYANYTYHGPVRHHRWHLKGAGVAR
jgi:hypothetical protein